jgi:hypothetical protein
MEQSELLRKVVAGLNAIRVRYFVTGSIATIFYGEPRFTNDIDVVADLQESQVSDFCAHFPPPEFYVSSRPLGMRFDVSHNSTSSTQTRD